MFKTLKKKLVATALAVGLLCAPVYAQTLSDQVLLLLSRTNTWTADQTFDNVTITGVCTGCGGAGGGTVTSVAQTVPSFLSISGSPIVGSGTLAITLATQADNTVFMGPASGGPLAPTFRALVDADIPDTITVTSLVWTDLDFSASDLSDIVTASAADITSGKLALARLTTGGTTGVPLVAGASDPVYAALDLSDTNVITGQLVAGSFPILTGDITTAGGSLATTLAVTGVTPATYGGSGVVAQITVDAGGRITAAADVTITTAALLSTTFCSDCVAQAPTRGSLIYVPVGGNWDEFPVGTANQFVTTDGTDVLWGVDGSQLTTLNGTNVASGLVGLTVGGSGKNMTAVNGGVVWTDAGSMEVTVAGSAGECLNSNGAAAPSWAACATLAAHNLLSATHGDTLAASVVRGDLIIGNSTPAHSRLAIGAAGTFPRSDGTDIAWSTDGSQLTLLNASAVTSGTLPLARLVGISDSNIADVSPPKVTVTGGTFGSWRYGTTTWDPADMATATEQVTTFALSGVAIGDICLVSHEEMLTDDLQLTAHVSVAGTVKAVLSNLTGGNINLMSGTLRIMCMEIS